MGDDFTTTTARCDAHGRRRSAERFFVLSGGFKNTIFIYGSVAPLRSSPDRFLKEKTDWLLSAFRSVAVNKNR
jgi:hypothetical protein